MRTAYEPGPGPVLRYYLDQSEAEIAETLGVSRGSVKKHASRGIAALAERLEARS